MSQELELRAPDGATRQLRWLGKDTPQVPEWDAAAAIKRGQQGQSYVHRAVEAPAEAIAGRMFRAGRVQPARPSDQGEPIECRLAQLLGPPPGGPNPNLSARELIRWTIISYLVTGRAAWEIETAPSGAIAALWPLPANELRAIPSDGGDGYWKRFEYGSPHEPTKLRPENVFYWWRQSQHDPREPESPLRAAGLPASILIAAERYLYAFLENGAVPAAVVTTTAFPDDESRQAFRRQWGGRFQGPTNAGRVAFNEAEGYEDGDVSNAVSVEVLGASNKDAQLLELHGAARDQVLEAFGTPRSAVGDASGKTFANAEAELKVWWRSRLVPLAADLAGAINMQLAPRLGGEVGWFDLSDVPELKDHQPLDATAAATLVGAGIITPDEARQPFGLPPIPGGSTVRPPQVTLPAPGAAATPERAAQAPTVVQVLPAAPGGQEGRAGVTVDRWRAATAAERSLELSWERAWSRYFERQRTNVLKRLRGNQRSKAFVSLAEARALDGITDPRGRPVDFRASADQVFDPAFHREHAADLAERLYETVVATAAGKAARVGLSFDLSDGWVRAFIGDRANQLAGYVTDTTYRQIQAALAEGVLEGESIDDLARRIDDVFDHATRERATTIARTEVISASNGASVRAAEEIGRGIVDSLEWIATSDGRTREAHAAADGQRVPVGGRFLVGGDQMAYPGDPAGGGDQTVNCRCAVVMVPTGAEVAA